MDYNTEEQEIDLKDLMFAVFHKWRPLILVAVICGLLLGGVKGFMTYKEQSDPEVRKEADLTYSADLELYEKNKDTYEKEIENLRTDIANQQDYLDNSIWINMSPYDVYEARADFYVSTGYTIMPGMTYQNRDYTDTILQAYQSMLTSSAVMEDIAKKVGTEPRYLQELVTVTIGTIGTNGNQFSRLLTIDVNHTSEEKAKEVLDAFLVYIEEMKTQITASIGEHTVSTVSESVSSMVNLDLADLQKKQVQKLTDLNDSLQEKQTELDELVEPKKEDSSKRAAAKDAVKFGVIGGFGGAFLVAFIVCIAFVMGDKVYSARELKDRYKVKILGKLSDGKKVDAIDAWLNRLEGRACNGNPETEYGLIAANVKNYAGDRKKLLITGSAAADVLERAAEALKAELGEFSVIVGNNMLEDVKTVQVLPECDGVILVEQCGVSKYSAVEAEIEKTNDLGKCVVGCVVFE